MIARVGISVASFGLLLWNTATNMLLNIGGVFPITSSELADQVPRDRTGPLWAERLRVLSHPRLLIIHEVGYVLPYIVASYFVFSLVCRRCERGATVWTSNKGFAEWASVFAGDEVLTVAILDRLLHHSTVINIRGRSYRLKGKLQAGSFVTLSEDKDNRQSKGKR